MFMTAGLFARMMYQRSQRSGRPARVASSGWTLEEAIRTRRTHKAYGPDPVPREELDELLELARWAPNHDLTNPWRFRVRRARVARAG